MPDEDKAARAEEGHGLTRAHECGDCGGSAVEYGEIHIGLGGEEGGSVGVLLLVYEEIFFPEDTDDALWRDRTICH